MNCDIIIYTKDRACQLDLLLRSIKYKFENVGLVDVLYDYSDESYLEGYTNIFKKDYKLNIRYHRQHKDIFYSVVKNAVNECPSNYILLLCDDDCFIRGFDFDKVISDLNDNCIGINLRASKDLTISYHTGQIVEKPNYVSNLDTHFLWDWMKESNMLRWAYPYQAGGMIYSKVFLQHIINSISFNNPTWLETGMMENRYKFKKNLIIGLTKSSVVNLSINRIQNVCNNRAGRDFSYSVKELNDLFLQGKIIDYSILDNLDNNCEFVEIQLRFNE